MKLMNIADEGAQYKWQLYDLYDKAFPEQEKKPLQVMEQLAADGKMEMLALVDEDEFAGLAINLIDEENAEECKRRKAFYLRNGLKETGLFVNVYDTDFELLTPDGELTFWEYVDFLREVMYEEYVEILRPTLIAMKKK